MTDNQAFLLTGALDFSTVMMQYQKSLSYLANTNSLIFDFSQVSHSNSAGLALIIEWIKFAQLKAKPIQFRSISPDLISIAKVAGLEALVLRHSS